MNVLKTLLLGMEIEKKQKQNETKQQGPSKEQ